MRRAATLAAAALLGALLLPPPGVAGTAAGDRGSDRIGDPALRAAITGPAAERAFGAGRLGRPTLRDDAGDIAIELLVEDLAVGERAVRRAGGRPTGSAGGSLLTARVPADRLAELSGAPGVRRVAAPRAANLPVLAPQTATAVAGTKGAEPVTATQAAAWHDAGITGFGVKVGVIDYFDPTAWGSAQAAGELPAPAGTFCQLVGSPCAEFPAEYYTSPHGNAVAEVIHDMAPSAQLYRVSAYSAADLADAIDWLQARGVRLLSRSLTAEYDGPGDGRGPLDDVVADAVARGMTVVNAAGNSAGPSSEGGYWRGTWTDVDADGFLEFGPGVGERLAFRCAFANGVRWDDFDDASPTDFDVYRYDDANSVTPEFVSGADSRVSDAVDQPLVPPLESMVCDDPGDVDYLAIRRDAAGGSPVGDVIEFQVNGGQVQSSTNPYSASVPIVDSTVAGVIGVGALVGTSVVSYSSRGPTNDGRIAPDLAAVTQFSSFSLGTFAGTSAATPVVAGSAALLLQATPALTPAQVNSQLVAATVDRGSPGPDNDTGAGQLVLPAPPAPATSPEYVPLIPRRLLDTRNGTGGSVGPVAAGAEVQVPVAGVGAPAVPATAQAAALTVTAVGSGPGYVTAYPCGTARPAVSTLNTRPGAAVPNLALVKPGTGGKVCLYSSTATHLLVDLAGYAPAAAGYRAAAGERLLDSRTGQVRIKAGETWPVPVIQAGTGQVPVGAAAALLNVVAVDPKAAGHLTVFPCGPDVPNASTLNTVAGRTVANAAAVAIGGWGAVCVFASMETHLVVDLAGWWPTGSAYSPVLPQRLLDSRSGLGAPARQVEAGETVALQVTGAAPRPPGGTPAVALTVTAVGAAGGGYISVFPCGAVRPTASVVNLATDSAVAGTIPVRVGAEGKVCLYASARTHLIADLGGWFAAS